MPFIRPSAPPQRHFCQAAFAGAVASFCAVRYIDDKGLRLQNAGRNMLQFVDLVFHVRFTKGGYLPPYLGATLRGAFGFALKRIACHVHHRDCDRCILRSRCVYPTVFLGVPPDDRTILRKYPYVPQPFVLRVGADDGGNVLEGEARAFGLRLFGPAIDSAPYLIYAVTSMGQSGLGRERLTFELESVDDGFTTVFHAGRDGELLGPRAQSIRAPETAAAAATTRIRWETTTPVRLRTNGVVRETLDLEDVTRASLRRLAILSHFFGQGEMRPSGMGPLLEAAASARMLEGDWRPFQFARYSRRQETRMLLDGFVGRGVFELTSPELAGWLAAAAECHVGKATSFGFGRIICGELP